MASLNEVKYAALAAQVSGDALNDLELAWLLSETGESSGSIMELWYLLMDQQGFSSGTLGDRWYGWLGSLGYSGTLNERFYQFWSDGGNITPPVIPPNAILDRDGNPILDRDGNYVVTR